VIGLESYLTKKTTRHCLKESPHTRRSSTSVSTQLSVLISSDGYYVGSSRCSKSDKILNPFLFGDGKSLSQIPISTSNYQTSAPDEANSLCLDAVEYAPAGCNGGVAGTDDASAPHTNNFQHTVAKPASITWSDAHTGESVITFEFGFKNCGASGADGNKC
jgi:hypothetical protein